MTLEAIQKEWKSGKFKPVYWFEGEESYQIDKAVEFAEKKILTEAEESFNLSIFYGRDSDWAAIVNACRRYPVFAERQVVIIKEAQHLKEIDKLESYIENPLTSTLLVVAYKEKKLDARTKFSKLIKDKGELFTTKKMNESQLPDWTMQLVQQKKFNIHPKAVNLLVDHIGNDLSRLENEIEKIIVNLAGKKEITEDDVERYVGVSKEFNAFELQTAIAQRNFSKAIRIIQYFDANPKAGPIQLVLPSLYSFFSKVFMLFGAEGDDRSVATTIGVNPYFFKDYKNAASIYKYEGIEAILLLLHEYNLKSIGVGSANSSDSGLLLKELVMKISLIR